jgi:hypothetical protein
MNKAVIIFALILFRLVNASCQTSADKKNYGLTIAMDSTFDFDLLSNTILLSTKYKSSVNWKFDETKRIYLYRWDSLTSANYIFKINTIFKKSKQFNILLPRDTNYILDSELGYNLTELIDKNELFQSDTIEFVYINSACMGQYSETSILTKNNENYTLRSTSTKKKKVDKSIINSLFQLQLDSKKESDKLVRKGVRFSTTTQSFYLLAKNKLFKFNDQGIENWDLYDKFKATYIDKN